LHYVLGIADDGWDGDGMGKGMGPGW